MPRAALLIEFVSLFIGLPLAYRFLPFRISPLPVLWAVALYCYLVLRSDPSFSMASLWNTASIKNQLGSVLGIAAAVAILLGAGVRIFAPAMLFGLVRERPVLWAVIMVAYPVLSVYPQSIVYRAFLMHRYSRFPDGLSTSAGVKTFLLILASAAAFAFMHIIFRNSLAVVLTFAGGLLFAWRYQTSHSLALSALEHSLYGCMLFTVGLGRYFYHGSFRIS
jgi:uncharacterized protein